MEGSTSVPDFRIKKATEHDVPLILTFIRELADYEKLGHEVVATEAILHKSLFGKRRSAETIIGYYHEEPVSFALFFHNFSTFLGKPGIYIEDLYVRPGKRGQGMGKAMFSYLARLARERNCGRLEWWVLDRNEPAIRFYQRLGASPMDEWTVFRLTGAALDELAQL